MDEPQFLLKSDGPKALYSRLTTPELGFEQIAAATKVQLSPDARKILTGFGGGGDEGMPELNVVRRLIERHQAETAHPELRVLRERTAKNTTSTRLTKRAPDELIPQAPGAVRAVKNQWGNFEEYDANGNLVFSRLAGVELPLEFRQ